MENLNHQGPSGRIVARTLRISVQATTWPELSKRGWIEY